MNHPNSNKLSSNQKNYLGRVYQFIIARGRHNRAKLKQTQTVADSALLKVNPLARARLR